MPGEFLQTIPVRRGESLPHAGDQKDLIIHGQPESQANEEDRHKRDQRTRSGDEATQTFLPEQHRNAKSRAHRKQEPGPGYQRHQQGPENHDQQEHSHADDYRQIHWHDLGQALSDIHLHRGQARQADADTRGAFHLRVDAVEVFHQVDGGGISRAGFRGDQDLGGAAVVGKRNQLGVLDGSQGVDLVDGVQKTRAGSFILAGELFSITLQLDHRLQRGGVLIDGVGVDKRQQRAIRARTKPLGLQIRGLALSGFRVTSGVVRQRELQARQRRSSRTHSEHDQQQQHSRETLHEPHPAPTQRRALLHLAVTTRAASNAGECEAEGAIAKQTQNRRKQG